MHRFVVDCSLKRASCWSLRLHRAEHSPGQRDKVSRSQPSLPLPRIGTSLLRVYLLHTVPPATPLLAHAPRQAACIQRTRPNAILTGREACQTLPRGGADAKLSFGAVASVQWHAGWCEGRVLATFWRLFARWCYIFPPQRRTGGG